MVSSWLDYAPFCIASLIYRFFEEDQGLLSALGSNKLVGLVIFLIKQVNEDALSNFKHSIQLTQKMASLHELIQALLIAGYTALVNAPPPHKHKA